MHDCLSRKTVSISPKLGFSTTSDGKLVAWNPSLGRMGLYAKRRGSRQWVIPDLQYARTYKRSLGVGFLLWISLFGLVGFAGMLIESSLDSILALGVEPQAGLGVKFWFQLVFALVLIAGYCLFLLKISSKFFVDNIAEHETWLVNVRGIGSKNRLHLWRSIAAYEVIQAGSYLKIRLYRHSFYQPLDVPLPLESPWQSRVIQRYVAKHVQPLAGHPDCQLLLTTNQHLPRVWSYLFLMIWLVVFAIFGLVAVRSGLVIGDMDLRVVLFVVALVGFGGWSVGWSVIGRRWFEKKWPEFWKVYRFDLDALATAAFIFALIGLLIGGLVSSAIDAVQMLMSHMPK